MARYYRPLPVFLISLAVAILTVAWSREFLDYLPADYDLNLHYFGAIVERSGSYTESDRVFRLQEDATGIAQPEGVIGTPTLIALIYVPLSFLSLHTTVIVWQVIAVVALAFALLAAFPRRHWPFLPLAFCVYPVLLGLYVGNISVITSALIIYAYAALKQGNDRRVGVALGIAAAFKLYPGFLLLALIAHRRWVSVKWMVGVASALTLLALAVLGPHDFYDGFHRTLTFDSWKMMYQENISVPGHLLVLWGNIPLAKVACAVVLLGGAFLVLRKPTGPPAYSLAALSLVMVLGQPLSWSHYFVVLLVGFAAALDMGIGRWSRLLVVIAVVEALSPWEETAQISLAAALLVGVIVAGQRRLRHLEQSRPDRIDDVIEPVG